ncbi:hypothetical protein KAR91_14310 [Candidatus Pacearchaeota archaeon]|nr:hypothetical protein [Candidatus Pacearchaeota archaeon]
MSKFIVLGLEEQEVVHEVSRGGTHTEESMKVLGRYINTFDSKEMALDYISKEDVNYEHGYTILETWE